MNLKNAKRSEDTEQIAVVYWAMYNAAQYPELKWLHHAQMVAGETSRKR